MENLTSAVGVSAQDEPRLKPLQQLRWEKKKRPKSTLEAASLHHRFHHLNANTAEDLRAGRPPSTTRRTSLWIAGGAPQLALRPALCSWRRSLCTVGSAAGEADVRTSVC